MSAASRATSTALGDRDADVGRVQRRRVVDAVAQEADDVAAALERQDDRGSSARATRARRRVRLLGDRPERRVGHRARARRRARSRRASSPTCSADVPRRPARCRPVRIFTVDAVRGERARASRRRPSQRRIGEGRGTRRGRGPRSSARRVRGLASTRGRRPPARGIPAALSAGSAPRARSRAAVVERARRPPSR